MNRFIDHVLDVDDCHVLPEDSDTPIVQVDCEDDDVDWKPTTKHEYLVTLQDYGSPIALPFYG